MPDEPNPTPVATDPPPDPAYPALDADGKPFMEKFKEFERKALEEKARADAAERLNEQYMAALGTARTQPNPNPAPAQNALEQALAQYQPQDRQALSTLFQEAVRQAVEQSKKETQVYSYDLLTRMGHQQQLQDQELMAEAQKQYGIIAQNPLWASASDVLKQDRAIAEARAILAGKRAPSPAPGPTNLPGTRPPAPTPSAPDKEKFMKQFMDNPDNRDLYRRMTRKEPTEEIMRMAAESEWQATQSPIGHFSPDSAVGKAAQAILANAGRTSQ